MKRKLLLLMGVSLMLSACTKNSQGPTTSELSNAATPGIGGRSLATTGNAAINASTVQQTVEGFGGASILQYIADLTSAQRTTAFSPTTGIGLSILRVAVDTSSSAFAAEVPTI